LESTFAIALTIGDHDRRTVREEDSLLLGFRIAWDLTMLIDKRNLQVEP
jgi:hypothetical protein